MLGRGNVDVFNYMNDKQWHLGSSSSAQAKILQSCKIIKTVNTFKTSLISDVTNHRGAINVEHNIECLYLIFYAQIYLLVYCSFSIEVLRF